LHLGPPMAKRTDLEWTVHYYGQLKPDEKIGFLAQIHVTAEQLMALRRLMTLDEQKRYVLDLVRHARENYVPLLAMQMLDFIERNPNATREEILGGSVDGVDRIMQNTAEAAAIEAKRQRDRKPRAKTVERNAQMCRLHEEEPKKWSLKKLSKHFGIKSTGYISDVLSQASMWKDLDFDRRRAAGEDGPF
jgi:hypothetical protein